MYFYIYDKLAQKASYAKKLSQINIKLSNLGILDEKTQVNPLRPVEVIIKDALQDKRCTNIIAIGDDKIASQILNFIAYSGKKVAFGIIPLRESKIAQSLGMPEDNPESCCKELLARKIMKVDLGKINNQYFLTSAEIEAFPEKEIKSILKKFFKRTPPKINLEFKEGFSISAQVEKYSIINIPTLDNLKEIKKGEIRKEINPYDKLLDVIIFEDVKSKKENQKQLSFFQTKRLNLESKNKIQLKADGQMIKKSSLNITVIPRFFSVIVGKNRLF